METLTNREKVMYVWIKYKTSESMQTIGIVDGFDNRFGIVNSLVKKGLITAFFDGGKMVCRLLARSI